MRVLIALGGNALLRRGEPMTAGNQRKNVRTACEAIAPICADNDVIITHGNGPQVGLLALQAMAYTEVEPYPLDLLGAETEGMIGYLIEQELGNLLPFEKPLATVLTMTEVDPNDPAFANPTKFVGPIYDEATSARLSEELGWTVKADGDHFRRVVASPRPLRIFQGDPIRWLLEKGTIVICAGGGGIPTSYRAGTNVLEGIEAVIDKDMASMVVARDLDVDLMVIATDAAGVYLDWGTPEARIIEESSPDDLEAFGFPPGSMGPKVEAACAFARATGNTAVIGSLDQLEHVLAGTAGTRISNGVQAMTFA